MRKALLALAFAGSALGGAAGAQTPIARPMPPMPGMNPVAGDRDGVVTRERYLADAAARFAQMDTDHDGVVTAGERDSYREAMRDRRIADGAPPPPPPPPPPGRHRDMRPERGGPGGPGGGRELKRDDYMARAAERFDRMDANHDGRLDPSEMAAMRDMRGGRRDGEAPPPPPPAR